MYNVDSIHIQPYSKDLNTLPGLLMFVHNASLSDKITEKLFTTFRSLLKVAYNFDNIVGQIKYSTDGLSLMSTLNMLPDVATTTLYFSLLELERCIS